MCVRANKETKCECIVSNDPTKVYVGELCLPVNIEPIKPLSTPSRWTPIIIGIIAGLTGLCGAITCCLWAVTVWRRRGLHHK